MDFWRFADPTVAVGSQLSGTYNPLLVAVSLGLSCLAGITALLVADRIAASPVSAHRRYWLLGGAFAMGAGIWSMHFTGMLAYTLPVGMHYGPVITSLSLVPAILGSGFALHYILVAQPKLWDPKLQTGALLMAAGIGSMHYLGMEAMQMPALLRYDFTLFVLSLVFAHVLAMIAIYVRLTLDRSSGMPVLMAPLLGGIVLGLAVAGMHYTGMIGATFYALPQAVDSHAGTSHVVLASMIGAFAILILVITILAAWVDNIRQAMREQLRTDAVSGLPNREALNQYLGGVLARRRTDDKSIYLMIVGLTDFNGINTSLGHAAGDAVLKETARRLKAKSAGQFFVARFAGDEFAIVLSGDVSNRGRVAAYATQILTTVEQPVQAAGLKLYLQAAVGISIYSGEDIGAEGLIDQAHNAMREAKLDKQSYCFYSDVLGDDARERLWIRTELREALANGQLELHYQPQVMLASGDLVGLEALVRWHHPQRGWISPQNFIPVIESMGLMLELDDFVLEQACLQGKKWLDAGVAVGRIGVNVSPQYLEQPEALSKISAALDKAGLPGRCLQLEVTETKLLNYEYVVTERFIDIRARGLTLAIDDFGTGYSSLSYLSELPVDKLKLDQSFVKNLSRDPRSRAIPEAVVGMAKGLGLALIAEGVETEEQRRILMELGYTQGQGYLYARPLPAAEISRLGTDAIAPGVRMSMALAK